MPTAGAPSPWAGPGPGAGRARTGMARPRAHRAPRPLQGVPGCSESVPERSVAICPVPGPARRGPSESPGAVRKPLRTRRRSRGRSLDVRRTTLRRKHDVGGEGPFPHRSPALRWETSGRTPHPMRLRGSFALGERQLHSTPLFHDDPRSCSDSNFSMGALGKGTPPNLFTKQHCPGTAGGPLHPESESDHEWC